MVPGNAATATAPAFPPAEFQPGSVGDELYTPLVRIRNAGNHVYNAPMIAFDVDEEDLDFCEGGAPYGSTGIIINCPIVHRFLWRIVWRQRHVAADRRNPERDFGGLDEVILLICSHRYKNRIIVFWPDYRLCVRSGHRW